MTRSGYMCEEVNLQSQDECLCLPRVECSLRPVLSCSNLNDTSPQQKSFLVFPIQLSFGSYTRASQKNLCWGDGVSTSHGIIRTRNFCNLFGKLSLSLAVNL